MDENLEEDVSPSVRLMFGVSWKKKVSKVNISSLSSDEKAFIAKICLNKEGTSGDVSKRTGIPDRTIRRWIQKVEKGEKISSNSKGGRYSLLTKKSEKVLIDLVNSDQKYSVSTIEFNKVMLDCIKSDYSERTNTVCNVKMPSKKTLKRIDNTLGLTNKNGEETTDARAKATADIRNAASFIAGQLVMGEIVPPELHVNIDATSYTVGRDTTASKQIKTNKGKVDKMKVYKLMPMKNDDAGCGLYSVKYYLMITASGTAGPPVYVLAHHGVHEGKVYFCLQIHFNRLYMILNR